jgi:uncharacterized protein
MQVWKLQKNLPVYMFGGEISVVSSIDASIAGSFLISSNSNVTNMEKKMNEMSSSAAKRAVVIYHGNCDDGFGAAFAFHLFKEAGYEVTEYMEGHYGSGGSFLATKETDVYILDFSFPGSMLVGMAGLANSVTLLDHHKTAKEDWEKFKESWSGPLPENLHVTFDMERSGAMMAFEEFAGPDSETNDAIYYHSFFTFLQDRDLWKFHCPDTKSFTQYLRSFEKTFTNWQDISVELNHRYEQVIAAGEAITRRYDQLCREIVDSGAHEICVNGILGYECNCPPSFSSDVGNILAQKHGTFGHTWYQKPDGSSGHSLRSIGDLDISAWAKKFGGGGHKNAAGFSLVPGTMEMGMASEFFQETSRIKLTQELLHGEIPKE